MNLSTAEVNYLSAIHRLSRKGKRVSTNALAGEFSIAPASVTDMIQRLAEKNLVEYIPYKGVNLSENGLPIAEKYQSGSLLWTRFLTNFLGIEEDQAERYSAEFQSVRSEEVFARLQEFLENDEPTKTIIKEVIKKVEVPVVVEKEVVKEIIKEVERSQPKETKDEPIQQNELSEKKKKDTLATNTLASARIGKAYKVVGVQFVNDDILEIIKLFHLEIGSPIKLNTQYDFDHSYLVQVNDTEYVMSKAIAEQIIVQ